MCHSCSSILWFHNILLMRHILFSYCKNAKIAVAISTFLSSVSMQNWLSCVLSSPCIMCTGTSLLYKIPQVIVGENLTFQSIGEKLFVENNVEVILLQDKRCVQVWQNKLGRLIKEVYYSFIKRYSFCVFH